jgi:hypothetical protein
MLASTPLICITTSCLLGHKWHRIHVIITALAIDTSSCNTKEILWQDIQLLTNKMQFDAQATMHITRAADKGSARNLGLISDFFLIFYEFLCLTQVKTFFRMRIWSTGDNFFPRFSFALELAQLASKKL